MSDTPKRAWFQIHLSTAIVLMFVAGGLLWANCRPVIYENGNYTRGFPVPYYFSQEFQETMGHSFGPFEPVLLILDGLLGLAVIATCALVCECRIRRVRGALIASYCFLFCLSSFCIFVFITTLAQPWIGHRYPK